MYDTSFSIMKYEPHIVLHLGNSVVRRMSQFVRQIDFALDWMLIDAGKTLFRYVYVHSCA